ncbi:MAG: hypothetical protein AAGE80_15775 [Pseudomonadota bacterium]
MIGPFKSVDQRISAFLKRRGWIARTILIYAGLVIALAGVALTAMLPEALYSAGLTLAVIVLCDRFLMAPAVYRKT